MLKQQRKNHRLNFILMVGLLIFSYIGSNAQELHYQVKLICSPRKDSVLLRWAPATPETWRLANQYGYLVKRHTVLRKKKIPKEIEHTILTEKPLKPAPISVFEKYAEDKFFGIAAECIYGSTYEGISVGGNPHLAYKKYLEEKHRFSFALYAADQSIEVARFSGLYFVDKTAQTDEKYLYQVYINCPDSIVVDTAYAFTGISEYQPLPKPLDFRVEWGVKTANLSWDIQYLNHLYNSYFVEKSFDGGKTYQRTSENNSIQVSDNGVVPTRFYKTDTLNDNKTEVYYRIRGMSTFGEISPPSDSVFGRGMLPITKAPVIYYYETIDNIQVRLFWDYPDEMNDYITGFKIYRSKSPKLRKDIIYAGTDPSAREFIDSTPNITNYYLISVYIQTKEKLSALRTYVERVDSFPPKPPIIDNAIIDSSGRITLTWLSNTDDDLDGYRVYRANNKDFEFMNISPSVIHDTVYHDSTTLKTLTRNIYYKVKSVDMRQNQSHFSELITLTRPDIIPPVSPVIKKIINVENSAELNWVNSSSDDVLNHHIFRKQLKDSIFKEIAVLPKDDKVRSTYLDKEVVAGKEYSYYIAAEDEAGLLSPNSNYGYFKVPSNFVEGIKLKTRVSTDQVKIIWNIKTEKTVQKVIIYRSENNGPLRAYDNSQEQFYVDKRLSPEKKYMYAVKAIYTDGTSSSLSKSITVKM